MCFRGRLGIVVGLLSDLPTQPRSTQRPKPRSNPIAVDVRRAVKKVGVSRKKVERELGVRLSMKASFRGDAATHFSFNYPPGSVMMFTQLHDFCGGHAGSEDWSHAKRILCRAPRLYGQSAARPALGLVKFAATDGRDPMKSYNLFPIRHT